MINSRYRKLFIVTSDDYGFAGWIAVKLLLSGHEVFLINKKEKKSSFAKKIALSLTFGVGVVEYFARALCVKLIARKVIVQINSTSELYDLYASESPDSLFLMINFDEIIKCSCMYDKPNFLNFHPSLLPSYKGLGPIFWCFYDSLNTYLQDFGWTVHKINQHVDRGEIVANSTVSIDLNKSLWRAYKNVYLDVVFLNFIKKHCENGMYMVASSNNYDSTLNLAPNLRDVIKFLSLKHFILSKYVKFFLNGGVVGLFSWIVQLVALYLFEVLFGVNNMTYTLSVYAAFILSMLVNFYNQKKFVFKVNGNFYIFLLISLCAITVVNFISLLMINYIDLNMISKFAYPLSAIVISPLVFLLKNKFVFK